MTDKPLEYPFVEFDPLNLIISPELIGKSLEFKLGGYYLQFELPTPSNPETLIPQRKDDEEIYSSDDNVSAISWEEQENMWIPNAISVKRAKLIFLSSPEFERYKTETGYITNQLIDDLKEASKRAIELCLRTLRWKSGITLIGRYLASGEIIPDSTRGYVPSVYGKQEEFSGGTLRAKTYIQPALNAGVWKEIEQSLQRGEEPPLAFDLFSDAVYLALLGNYRRAYLELAMAAEVHVRTRVEEGLPSGLNAKELKKFRDKKYRQHLEDFYKTLEANEQKTLTKDDKKTLVKLLEDRNTIAHHGGHARSATTNKTVTFSRERFSTYRDVVERLLKH